MLSFDGGLREIMSEEVLDEVRKVSFLLFSRKR